VNPWLVCSLIVLVGALAPSLFVASRASATDRLVGLEIGSSVLVILLLLLTQAEQQSSYLIVPLVLVVLSFAGTLVFTRLLSPRR
jgi:multicomponent Na+:H+ antiporter subunit F